jgi:AcrR family transcriptional regulator
MTPQPDSRKPTLDERRATQREALIDAAERRIAEGGAAGLRARDLAQDIGVALGAIYNLVSDLDEIVFLVAGRTLMRLDRALTAAADEAAAHGRAPADELVAIAIAYFAFARSNTALWRETFTLRSSSERPLPDWMAGERKHMFRHILRPLASLLPDADPDARQLFAHTLFTASHGVIQLGLEQRLFAVPPAAIETQLEFFVRAICKGLHQTP